MARPYGTTSGNRLQPPTPVRRHRLVAGSGLAVEVLDLGATLASVEVPGPDGPVPLILDLPDLAAREDPRRNPYLGATVGRFANRIGGAMVTVDELAWLLDANEDDNQLHGGSIGFSHVVWDTDPGPADGTDGATPSITFRRRSPHGEMGFPGTLDVAVTYELADHEIRILHEATTDRATVVSLTNHAYWNLGGPADPDVRDHTVDIPAATVVPVDDAMIPSGPPVPVDGTVRDLRRPVRLGDRLGFGLPGGYDDCFVVDGHGLRRHATVTHPSGRRLEVWSDQPAVQFYTGAHLGGGAGAFGRVHEPFTALCLEPEAIPDAPNLDWAPPAVLRPGERYVHDLRLRLHWEPA